MNKQEMEKVRKIKEKYNIQDRIELHTGREQNSYQEKENIREKYTKIVEKSMEYIGRISEYINRNKEYVAIFVIICSIIIYVVYINWVKGESVIFKEAKSAEKEQIEEEIKTEKGTEKENIFLEEEENRESTKEKKNDFEKMVVHIDGKVKNPGVYEIEMGKRIKDIVEMAGGLLKEADLEEINLAMKLVDGEKIYIPSKNEKNMIEKHKNIGNWERKENDSKPQNKVRNKININRATEEELEEIPGIGKEMARRIIEYRKEKGKFSSKEELKEIKGIGEVKYKKLENDITV